MPGPVSDSYDPVFGTGAAAEEVREAMQDMYRKLSKVLGNKPPIFITSLVDMDLNDAIQATLTEKEWRLLRYACECAIEF